MQKQAPSAGRILIMVAFALSCFGILLYLWVVFGGATPLRAQGYQVKIPFSEASLLAQEADVRISGVTVGKVKQKALSKDQKYTIATIQLDPQYAPIPADTRSILRQKTLLGETYVELTPGNRSGPKLHDGATLPPGKVSQSVELDEILRLFDAKTRNAFRVWMEQQGQAVNDQGQNINDVLGNLAPFAENTTKVLTILNSQDRATKLLVRNTGQVFSALTERQGQLRNLITNSNRVFQTTADRNAQLADTFTVLPTFLRESRLTTTRVTAFARNTNPLINQLRPAARQLTPTLLDLHALAPDLRGLAKDLGPLIDVSIPGLPAVQAVLNDTEPLLAGLEPFLRNLNPVLLAFTAFKSEFTAFFANSAAATQVTDQPPGFDQPVHYLRTTNPVNPESLAAYPNRPVTNRSNPYMFPRGFDNLGKGGLKVFGQYLCSSTQSVPGLALVNPLLPASTRALIDQFVYGGQPPGAVPAPPCSAQTPLGNLLGQPGVYPHLLQEPPG
jgi:phospholipid/cholesterol/gamma-HCH transport system substrate-binding protein